MEIDHVVNNGSAMHQLLNSVSIIFTDCYIFIVYHIVHNDDGEWCVGEVMTHPLEDYGLKLTERRKQSTSKFNSININHKYVVYTKFMIER